MLYMMQFSKDALKLLIAFAGTDALKVRILPIHGDERFFHLFAPSLVPFINVSWFNDRDLVPFR